MERDTSWDDPQLSDGNMPTPKDTNMKVNFKDIGGEIIRQNSTYVVIDNKTLNNL